MCEGPSAISGPIPPDPSLFPEYYKRPSSAQGRLQGNADQPRGPMLSGPLAPDPGLHPGWYSARAPLPPRIGPNAAHILERGQRGVVGNLLKMDEASLGPFPPRHKQLVRDYGKENVRRLREIQKRSRELEMQRERARPTPVKGLWTSTKYQDVPSRVMSQLQENTSPKKPECQNFLKAHSLCGSAGRPKSSPTHLAASPKPSRRGSDNSDLQLEVEGRTVNFVSHNARAAGRTVMRRSQSLQNLGGKQVAPPSAVKGHVPKYLEERKEQWRREEEERKKSVPDPSIPAGHTRMAERERRETLQSLKETHRSLISELLSLPVRADTLAVRSRHTQLDRKLSEVEEAIKVFSRDKVYVKTDS